MANELSAPRADAFATAPLPWIVVSHFLSTDLLEEFSTALVESRGGGEIALSDLFNMQHSSEPPVLRSWLIQPKLVEEDLHRALQDAVRMLVWQSDESVSPAQPDAVGPVAELRNGLAAAFQLGHVDFGTVKGWQQSWPQAPVELGDIARAIAMVRDLGTEGKDVSLEGLVKRLRSDFAFPLSAVLTKHLGDLAADVDDPVLAMALYLQAEAEVTAAEDSAWSEFRTQLLAVITQSRAAMLRLIDGPAAAAAFLNIALAATPFEAQPLLHVNATLDAMNATLQAGDNPMMFPKDVRPSVLWSPQVLEAKDLSSAFTYQAEKEFRSASRRYWAGIRRFVAGGSASLTQEAKAHYARNLRDELVEVSGRHRRPETFGMALRLLIESGRQDLAKATSWPRALLEDYLDAQAIEAAIAHMSKHKGARPERLGVLIATVANWLLELPHERAAEAETLMRFLADVALTERWSQTSRWAFPRAAFEAIKATGDARPEFRRAAADPLVAAIVKHLGDESFLAWISALEAGVALVDALPEVPLRTLLDATLHRLETLEPKTASWPVTRPALSLLTDDVSRKLWESDRALAERSAATILRYGVEQESERTRLLSLLGTVSPYLPDASRTDPRVAAVVVEVRKDVHQINSSAVTSNICALLASPGVSGLAGVADAIDALRRIMESATGRNESIATAYAYPALMILTQRHAQMVKDLDGSELDGLMRTLIEPLQVFWRTAANKPSLFAPLSFPEPSAPNATLVHNWTFASIGFARMLGVEADLETAMAGAASNPLLAGGIATGRSARLTAGDPEVVRPESLAREPAPAFYGALGQRIVRLRDMGPATRVEVLRELIAQCFRLGPNGLDAVVFTLAQQDRVQVDPQTTPYKDYRDRLDAHKDLRMGLTPILDDLIAGLRYEALF